MTTIPRELAACFAAAIFMAAFFASFFFIGDIREIVYSMVLLGLAMIVPFIIVEGV